MLTAPLEPRCVMGVALLTVPVRVPTILAARILFVRDAVNVGSPCAAGHLVELHKQGINLVAARADGMTGVLQLQCVLQETELRWCGALCKTKAGKAKNMEERYVDHGGPLTWAGSKEWSQGCEGHVHGVRRGSCLATQGRVAAGVI